MNNLISVVGCGHWGKNLIRNFFNLNSLFSICDSNTELAKRYADQYNVREQTFTDILNDSNIQGVVLAVPAKMHASMAMKVMNSGKHVFVEKPLAMNESEAEMMINASKDNNVQLMVGHLMQYHPIFTKIKQLVDAGEIGELSYIYSNRLSFGKVRSEEDVIWSFAPHDISMILSLVDHEPKFVRTNSFSILQKNISDNATIQIEFASGLRSNISVSWVNPYKEQKLVVTGKDAMLVFDDTKPWNEKLGLYSYKVITTKHSINLEKSNVNYIKVKEEEPLKNECQHFIDVVKKNIKPLTDKSEGLNVVRVLTAASQSQRENKVVRIKNNE
tara:strand:- start:166 stop:1155 length:990 start_codon:yes stop_codon:yes gene_type:complete